MSTILARLAALEQRAKMQGESFAEMMSGGDFIMVDIMTREAWNKARRRFLAHLDAEFSGAKPELKHG